jgi:hypothetical protein
MRPKANLLGPLLQLRPFLDSSFAPFRDFLRTLVTDPFLDASSAPVGGPWELFADPGHRLNPFI